MTIHDTLHGSAHVKTHLSIWPLENSVTALDPLCRRRSSSLCAPLMSLTSLAYPLNLFIWRRNLEAMVLSFVGSARDVDLPTRTKNICVLMFKILSFRCQRHQRNKRTTHSSRPQASFLKNLPPAIFAWRYHFFRGPSRHVTLPCSQAGNATE